MNVLEKLGLAVRDGVYETFMEYTKTVDLEGLRASGYKVDEIPLTMNGLNRLYILQKDKAIHMGCTVTWDYKINDSIVMAYTPLETKELLRKVASGQK